MIRSILDDCASPASPPTTDGVGQLTPEGPPRRRETDQLARDRGRGSSAGCGSAPYPPGVQPHR
jgi:hypothetical protein